MRQRTLLKIGLIGVLPALVVGILLVSGSRRVQTTEASVVREAISITGAVRDFHADHPDFDASPAQGFGHYAGMTELSGVPAGLEYTGVGHKVLTPATDATGRAIAPPFAMIPEINTSVPRVATDHAFDADNSSRIDAFNSYAGTYGGSNVRHDALVSVNSTGSNTLQVRNTSKLYGSVLVGPGGDPDTVVQTSPNSVITGSRGVLPFVVPMPSFAPPPVGPSRGNVTYSSGTTVISEDMHVDDLTISSQGRVRIHGDVTIVCRDLTIGGKGLQVDHASKLTLYVTGAFRCETGKCNHEPGYPAQLVIYKLGTDPIDAVGVSAHVYAKIIAPQAALNIDQKSHVHGSFLGRMCNLNNNGKFHLDWGDYSGCGLVLGSSPATFLTPASDGGVTSASTFDQWYNDVPGTNISMPLPIVFVQQLDGSYLFDDAFDEHYASRGGFYPIDDQLFGNDTGTHNSYFTFAFEAGFVLDLATDPYFEVETDSDVWVYIDDQVAIDLGGVHGIHEQRVDLVSMCLLDGEPHTLRFYLAHRHGAGSKLRIRTNLELEGNQPPAITAPYD